MSTWTILFLMFFVVMIAMHLRGHGGHGHGQGGHGGGHGDRAGGHDHSSPRPEPAEPQPPETNHAAQPQRPESADRVSHHSHGEPT